MNETSPSLTTLATSKAQGVVDKLLAKAFDKNMHAEYPTGTRLVLKAYLDVADEHGAATARLTIPLTVVDGKAIFDSVVPPIRGDVPPRAPAVSASTASRINENAVSVIVQSVREYESFHRPLKRNDFVWVGDDCEIPEDEMAVSA